MIRSDYKIESDYKVEIDAPNIVELISETFDGAWNLMTPNSIIFGGTIRDAVAGFGLTESVNVLVIQDERHKLLSNLRMSNKWVEDDVIKVYKEISETRSEQQPPIVATRPSFHVKDKRHNGRTPTKIFVNQDDRKIQIITVPNALFDLPTIETLRIARNVDFKCCGFVMDIEGKIYETIEGAYSDCLEKKLRINLNSDINIKCLSDKIERFVKRGWKSEINIEEVKHRLAKIKRTQKRKSKKLQANTHSAPSVSKNAVNIHVLKLSDFDIKMDIELPEFYFRTTSTDVIISRFKKMIMLYGICLPINSDMSYMSEYHTIRITLRNVGSPTINKLRCLLAAALLDYSKDLKQTSVVFSGFKEPYGRAKKSEQALPLTEAVEQVYAGLKKAQRVHTDLRENLLLGKEYKENEKWLKEQYRKTEKIESEKAERRLLKKKYKKEDEGSEQIKMPKEAEQTHFSNFKFKL